MKTQLWFLFLLGIILTSCRAMPAKNFVCFKRTCVEVEIALTQQDRQRGLQGRESLSESAGMLFIFPSPGQHGFWMKDTLIPLDMIWLDASRRVVHIEYQVPPCHQDTCPTYLPQNDALYVLEVNAGMAKQMGLSEGSSMEFRLDQYLAQP
jgi:uncharacterized protein